MDNSQNSMTAYMREINDIPLITPDEEIKLAKLIKKGDQEAKYKLITSNLRLVVKIAHDFKGLGFPLQDLIAEGNLGLMRAAEKFDPEKGAKFSSYAGWWIKQGMRRVILNTSKLIRVPVTSAGRINKIKSMRADLTRTLGRVPTDKEIAGNLNCSERVVSRLKVVNSHTVSLNIPISEGKDSSLIDLIPDEQTSTPDKILGDSELFQRISEVLGTLTEREQLIIHKRFGLDEEPAKTLEEVSKDFGLTRERVRQIQNRALVKLRSLINEEVKASDKQERVLCA